jgi:multiple sugar transport system substrate-binding protein
MVTFKRGVARRHGRTAAALLSVVMLAAGCTSSATPAPAASAPGASAAGGGSGVVLHAIFLPATWGTVVKGTLAPQYEKETGVKVDVQLIGRDGIHEKMATLLASGDSSFDIFNIDYNWVPEFGKAGYLVPMDNVLSAADKADFYPLALKVGTWNNQLLGIPQTIHPHLLWYRSDIYGDATVQAAYKAKTGATLAPPKTMDEWQQQAAYFNNTQFNGKTIYGWAAQAAKGFGNVHTWLSFAYSYGCTPFNADFTKSTLATPKCEAATQKWSDMMKLMPPGANEFTYDDVTAAAQQGTIATAIQWSWGAFAVDDPKTSQTVGKWEFTQVPAGPDGISGPHLAEWVISVSKYSKNVDAAQKFVAWLETKQNDVVQASLGGGDPVRQSSYSDPKLTQEKLADSSILRFRRYDQVKIAMANAQPRPFFPAEESWETVLSTQLSAISLGQSSVHDGLAAADAAENAALNK